MGMMSREARQGLTCITAARNSRSKWDSMRCFVTVFAMPFDCRPSNWRASRLPSQRSSKGTMPRKKNSHTRHMGAQNPTPGPLPTGPAQCNKLVSPDPAHLSAVRPVFGVLCQAQNSLEVLHKTSNCAHGNHHTFKGATGPHLC
jgi:hypothetical protein